MYLLWYWKRHLDRKLRNCSEIITELHKESKWTWKGCLFFDCQFNLCCWRPKSIPVQLIFGPYELYWSSFPRCQVFFMFYDGITLAAHHGKWVSGKLNPILQVCSFSSHQQILILRYSSPLFSFSTFFQEGKGKLHRFHDLLLDGPKPLIHQAVGTVRYARRKEWNIVGYRQMSTTNWC